MLLAVDTSSVACSVALCAGNDTIHRHVVAPREHTRILLPMVEELLAEAGVVPASLDALVLGNGPGSFIGLRIAASFVQGLAFSLDRPVVSVSSLAAVAAEAFEHSAAAQVVVAQDARMGQVYLGQYAKAPGFPRLLQAESIWRRDVPVLVADSGQAAAAGAAWFDDEALFELNSAALGERIDVRWPAARWLLPEARERFASGDQHDAASISPAYLRDEVAQTSS